jgi:Tol biopolymer transport system component
VAHPAIYAVSALGGPERLIAERAAQATWVPDGRSLVMVTRTPQMVVSLTVHDIDSGVQRTLTKAPAGFAENHPRVSPDGTLVAFERHGAGRAALFVVPTKGGEARQISEWISGLFGGLAWTPDGREILFARPDVSGRRLVRTTADGRTPFAPVTDVPFGAIGPSVSRPRAGASYRLAVMTSQVDLGLRLIDLQAARQDGTLTAAPFCDATRTDLPGRFSPDGTMVAFVSDRGGSQQVWLAGRDGSAVRSRGPP